MNRLIYSAFTLLLFVFVWPTNDVMADCTRPSTTYGDTVLGQSCTFDYTIDGVDNPQNIETSTTNNATITLGASNLTVGSGQTLVAGSFIVTGAGGIAIGSGTLLPGGGLWVVDADTVVDGWPADFTTRYTATAAGRRRMGLMKTTTADCDDTNGTLTNNCYSYSQSTYYNYGQANYYAYSQNQYYGYGQGAYYGYGQGAYYGYGQSSYASWVSGCFLAGTHVRMADGTLKAIETIRPGDIVLSYDLMSNQAVPETVTELLVHPETLDGYLVINNRLNVTGNHLMWAASRNAWIRADHLMVGDQFVGADGTRETIHSISHVDGTYTTYNLHLTGDNHNYFSEDILVHNWKM
jgi:hypothetical protein